MNHTLYNDVKMLSINELGPLKITKVCSNKYNYDGKIDNFNVETSINCIILLNLKTLPKSYFINISE